ncbi:MAG TPA: DUF2934 domain-containing protein [bacterium]|nr:DUF2934 domain-containing protein [bacterium]
MGREDEIRLIAYGIWEEEGRPDGRHLDHWLRAEIIWGGQSSEAAARGIKSASGGPVERDRRPRAAKKKSVG